MVCFYRQKSSNKFSVLFQFSTSQIGHILLYSTPENPDCIIFQLISYFRVDIKFLISEIFGITATFEPNSIFQTHSIFHHTLFLLHRIFTLSHYGHYVHPHHFFCTIGPLCDPPFSEVTWGAWIETATKRATCRMFLAVLFVFVYWLYLEDLCYLLPKDRTIPSFEGK